MGTNGHEPLVHQIDWNAEKLVLTCSIDGYVGDTQGLFYRVEVIDSNNDNPAVDASASPGSGHVLATANPFVVAASTSAMTIEFHFTSAPPIGTLVVNGSVVVGTSLP